MVEHQEQPDNGDLPLHKSRGFQLISGLACCAMFGWLLIYAVLEKEAIIPRGARGDDIVLTNSDYYWGLAALLCLFVMCVFLLLETLVDLKESHARNVIKGVLFFLAIVLVAIALIF